MPPTSPTSSVSSGIEAGLPGHAGAMFPCGQLLATPAALDLLLQRSVSPLSLLARHLRSDWGDLGAADAHANDQALTSGQRLLSRYNLLGGGTVFLLRYTLAGAKRSMRLGDYPSLDLAQARQLAMSARLQITQGIDPQATQPGPTAPDALTLADFMAQHYLPYAQGANRSYRDILGRWTIHLAPVFGHLPLTELRTQDIQRFHDAKRIELCAASANRILALLKRALNLAILWGLGGLAVNPVKGVRMHLENNQRQRYLVGDELRRFLAALDQEPSLPEASSISFEPTL